MDHGNETHNSTKTDDPCSTQLQHMYVIILEMICVVAMLVNIKVFLCIYWIRRPFAPTLRISLSLAAADFFTSLMSTIVLFYDDILPLIELVRMSGILITIIHLLALSLNHYIGIRKPLHYNSIVTESKMVLLIVLLWVVPPIFVITLVSIKSELSFWYKSLTFTCHKEDTQFMREYSFRMPYSCVCFITIILVCFCYIHILVIVRQHQKNWQSISRTGSTRWRGKVGSGGACGSHEERRKLQGNIRAFYTTLLIMGSCILGWLPAFLVYIIFCDTCFIPPEESKRFRCNYAVTIRFFDNLFLFLKMLANPIIYSTRMTEIQDGSRRMYHEISNIFCRRNKNAYSFRRSPTACSSNTHHIQLASLRSNKNGHVNFCGPDSRNTLV